MQQQLMLVLAVEIVGVPLVPKNGVCKIKALSNV